MRSVKTATALVAATSMAPGQDSGPLVPVVELVQRAYARTRTKVAPAIEADRRAAEDIRMTAAPATR